MPLFAGRRPGCPRGRSNAANMRFNDNATCMYNGGNGKAENNRYTYY